MGDKTEKTVKEIEDEISALEEEIEQIRVANAYLGDTRMMSHSTPTPFASITVLGTERETDSWVVSEGPSDFPMSLREDTRVKETYNDARSKVKFSTPYRVVREPELQNLKRNSQHELLNEEREQSYPLRGNMDSITVRHHRLRDRNKPSEDDDRGNPTTEHTHTGASIKPATFDGNGS